MNKLAKPFLLLLLVGSFIVVTSCNDGDEGEEFIAAEIVGTWSYNSFDFDATLDGVDFIKWLTDNLGGTAADYEAELDDLSDDFNEFEGVIMTFKEDGTALMSAPGEADQVGTWTLNESDRILTVTFDDEPLDLEVISLTSTSVVVTVSDTGDFFDLDQDGTAEELGITMTIGMTK